MRQVPCQGMGGEPPGPRPWSSDPRVQACCQGAGSRNRRLRAQKRVFTGDFSQGRRLCLDCTGHFLFAPTKAGEEISQAVAVKVAEPLDKTVHLARAGHCTKRHQRTSSVHPEQAGQLRGERRLQYREAPCAWPREGRRSDASDTRRTPRRPPHPKARLLLSRFARWLISAIATSAGWLTGPSRQAERSARRRDLNTSRADGDGTM